MTKTNLVEIDDLTVEEIASICDHTFLKTVDSFRGKGGSPVKKKSSGKLRAQAYETFLSETLLGQKPAAICVYHWDIPRAKESFSGTGIRLCSVVGFPDGSNYTTNHKIAEAKMAIDAGAEEIDMVLNYKALKRGDIKTAKKDIMRVTKAAHNKGALVKLIFENCELQAPQIADVCKIAQDYGIEFIKTSTGFSTYGATEADLIVMRHFFDGGIKIAGGANPDNIHSLLYAASGRNDGKIDLDPMKIRIGESSLLTKLMDDERFIKIISL